jgi:hypothetical protein
VTVKIDINGTDATNNNNNDNNSGGGNNDTCAIAGGTVGSGIELEGSISSASGSTFSMAVNGERSDAAVSVDASGASFQCAGVKGACDASLIKAGAKVHVSGTLTSCSTSAAQVKASEVKFQH